MPIANFFISRRELSQEIVEGLVKEWSKKIQVDEKDITMNFMTSYIQAGQNYEILVFLYLPSIWSKRSISNIQMTLFDLLIDTFSVSKKDVFILTNTIESGCVLDGGKEVTWVKN